ncbi:hypothetical protein BKA67DRAFT_11139 [Truncatella angustata]|uniref:Uncharacterized protein n=1 Tax=Truncatella angustata TaxID=152316 RepID=A0A9P9A2F6_9PEZI|nr:uncharacterized protein BKA67DRAFT_11139 [Truncatella angustata]KAH6659342.1 hypothetical protein BKA67DRAFT_11139 [Truncatella angustata]
MAPGQKHEHVRAGSLVRKGWFSRKERKRRPQISAPSNFRHVSSGGPRFSDHEDTQPSYRPRSFRPLQLNMNRLSSMMPYFGYPNPPVTPPNRAIVSSSDSDNTLSLKYQQSSSTLSFNIPRKPANPGSIFDSPQSDGIRRPAAARLRAQTSTEGQTPAMNELIERVATAMLERDQLQDQIDDVVERQSIHISSRPSTANGRRPSTTRSIPDVDMEPMPEVPALPMAGPSFSERLSFDRPRPTPIKVAAYGPPLTSVRPAAARALNSYTVAPGSRRVEGRAPPPPLPLRLRPPLRKKKSFSRVSSWLGFPVDVSHQHGRNVSLDSITNKPLPVLWDGGFYEVAAPVGTRTSSDSDETVSDWTSDDEKIEQQTLPTSWSPSSSATVRAVDPPRPVVLSQAPWRESVVGVAF